MRFLYVCTVHVIVLLLCMMFLYDVYFCVLYSIVSGTTVDYYGYHASHAHFLKSSH